jgi:hypothetical protein
LHHLREGRLRAVELAVAVVVEAVGVRVLAGLDHRAARAADGVRHQAAVKTHPFLRDAVHVRRFQQFPAVAIRANGLRGQVIAEDENDVRHLRRRGGGDEKK